MRHLKRLGWISVVIGISTLLDQFTKVIAQRELRGQPPMVSWGNLFRFEYAENPGAFLSMGAALSNNARLLILTYGVAVFLLVLFGYVVFTKTLSRAQTWALSFVLGGGISNLIDRFFRPSGRVIDFMNTGIGELRTGVFNVADMLIMAGIFYFLFLNLRQPVAEKV